MKKLYLVPILVITLLNNCFSQSLTNTEIGSFGGVNGSLQIASSPLTGTWQNSSGTLVITAILDDDSLNPVLGISDNPFASLHIYPNPTSELIHFSESINGSLNIYDANGKVVKSISQLEASKPIDISDFPEGIYHLILTDGDKHKKFKLIKSE